MIGSTEYAARRDLTNGLRTDLHEPNCEGMDEDGNWLGRCSCPDQHEGMPPIIWAGEASERWITALERLRGGYNVRLVIDAPSPNTPGRLQFTVEGAIFGVGRGDDGFAYVEILIDRYGPGTGRAARFSSEEITSIYIY